jgi:AraC-like DNA-binding protein
MSTFAKPFDASPVSSTGFGRPWTGALPQWVSLTTNPFFKFPLVRETLLAGERLNTSDDSISVIALSLGYESESAFGKAFKRVMGCSPRQYSRQEPPRAAFSIRNRTSYENRRKVAEVD